MLRQPFSRAILRTCLYTQTRHAAFPLKHVRPVPTRAFSHSVIRRAEELPEAEFPHSLDGNDTPEAFMYRKLMGKGVSLIQVNSLEQALEAFAEAQKLMDTSLVNYNLGVVYYQLKRISEAITHFEKSISLDPASEDAGSAHNNLATCYIFSDPPNSQKGIEHLRKAIELHPNDGEIRFNLGAILESSGFLEEAYAEYLAAKDLGVGQADPHLRNLGAKLARKMIDDAAAEEKQEKI